MPHEFSDDEIFVTDAELEGESGVPDIHDAQSEVGRMLDEALQWRKEHLDPLQEAATKRYLAKPIGDEEDGRSQIVMTDVRDTTRSLLTAMMRIFLGPDRVVEFDPVEAEDEAVAEQQTDYINHIVEKDNEGFRILYATFKDAFVRKLGVVKWWWEDMERIEGSQHSGLLAEDVDALLAEEGVEGEAVQSGFLEDPESGEQLPLFDIKIKRTTTEGRAKYDVVPSEEWVFSPKARSLRDARLVGHVRDMPASDLIAMGIDEDLVERAKGQSFQDDDGLEAARRIDFGSGQSEDEQPEEMRPVRFGDLYVRIALDGGKVAALHHIQVIGPQWEWVDPDPPIVTHAPFALFEMDPEPHTLVGGCVDDYVGDLQDISSQLVRGMLDSLALAIDPATLIVEGQVNVKDLLNPEMGRVIRAKRLDAMREISTPFVGGAALPVLQYMSEIRENRTGQSKAAAGLDADALQSSTRAAVAATVSGAAQRTELVARMLAETGMKQLFMGLNRLVIENQDRERVVRLRGEYVTVDPRSWNANADVKVNVALGTGLMEDRLQTLAATAAKNEEHLANGSPLGSLVSLRATYARILEMSGFPNATAFWPEFGEQEDKAFKDQQAQAQKPSDTEVLKEIEMAKIQARSAEKQAELQVRLAELDLEERIAIAQHSIKESELDNKTALEVAKLELDHKTKSIDAIHKMAGTNVGGE